MGRKFNGKLFSTWDAFPTKAGARESAKDIRKQGGKARVVKDNPLGRLKYTVYARGKYFNVEPVGNYSKPLKSRRRGT